MRAVSDDLLHWEKCGEFFLPAPEGYDGNDWRDPYILWDEGSEEYIMILGARKLEGEKRYAPAAQSGIPRRIWSIGNSRGDFGRRISTVCTKCPICSESATGGIC